MAQAFAQALSAETIPQTGAEEEIGQMYRGTYSPDDNKLRLYASLRLDEETYKKVHDAGFRWAPKQGLFVAPAWTPGREDVLLSLAGEIGDEDSTLFDRQEQRAVMLFERAEYWEERAQASLRHAKYKERPDVRYRRIKKIEAELRKAEKHIARSEKYLTMWRAQTLDLKMALLVSNYDHIYASFTLDKYPRPAEKSQYEGSMSLHSALSEDIITFEQARDIAIRCHERTIRHQQRWVNHYRNRLSYERAMLDESGGVVTRTQEFEPGGQVLSRGEWLTILRVNRSQGEVSSVETPCYRFLGYSGTMKLTPDRITDYKAPTAEEASDAKKAAKRPPIVNYPGEGFREMTKAEWARMPGDYKAVRGVAETETHGAYRFRRCMTHGCTLVNVYITDMKTVEIPKK